MNALMARIAWLAATVALAVGTVSACSPSSTTVVVVPSEQTPAPTSNNDTHVAPLEQNPVASQETIAPMGDPGSSGLIWTEIDLTDALGADEHSTIRLESVGDGRVLALSFSNRGIDMILVTEDGTNWTAVPVPAGFLPWNVDITGERWLIHGWDTNNESPSTQVLFSDDGGSSWPEIPIDLGLFKGTAWVGQAIVVEDRIVIVVLSDSEPLHIDEVLEESVEIESRIHILLSDGGPAELVTDFPGWFSGGFGASDGFHMIMSDDEGLYLLSSPDGRQWTRATVDAEIADSARNAIWTADKTDGKLKVERFEGVFGTDQVLTLPDGIGRVPGLAVGPAGVAAVGSPASPHDESGGDPTQPDIVIEKDGYELRYNQPEGGITLWDLENDSPVYVLDAEALQRQDLPEGVKEIEDDDGTLLVVFHDPETGAELVAFADERLAAAVVEAAATEEESAAYREYDPNEYLVGWSVDGADWEWQSIQEAFGLPQRSEDDNSFTEVQVAVGRDFVLAKIQTFELPASDFDEDTETGVGDGRPSAILTNPEISSPPPRWFIARVG